MHLRTISVPSSFHLHSIDRFTFSLPKLCGREFILQNLEIIKVEANTVYANLSGHMAVDILLSTGLSMVSNLLPDGVIETSSGGNIILHLDKSDKLQPILDKATLRDICFLQDAVEIIADLKIK